MEEVQKSQLPPDVSGFNPCLSAESVINVLVYEFVFNLLTSVLQQRAVNQTCLRSNLCPVLGFQCCYN